jgi:hypothetical protein
MVTVPKKPELGVKVTVHVPPPRVQVVAGENVPEEAGLCVNVTTPDGVTEVPVEVSVTVTTQLVGVLAGAIEGVQTMAVELVRLVAVNVVWPVLDAWFESPGYVAVKVLVISCPSEGVKAIVQVATPPPPLSVHVPPLPNTPPAPGLCVNDTAPVGVIVVPPETSVTVAVQVDGALTGSGDGAHDKVVVVDLWFVIVWASNGIT